MRVWMRRGVAAGLVAIATLCPVPGLSAQTAPEEPPSFEEVLYPPELIMQHRRAIGLTEDQRDRITGLITELQGTVNRLNWDLVDEMRELTDLVRQSRIDLDRALDRLDSALEIERQVKMAHLETLIRIKNLLTVEQQEQLTRLRDSG